MAKRADLLGQRFGRLVVTSCQGSLNNAMQWECTCDCGGQVRASTNALRSGSPKSCGCLRRENTARMFTKHGATKAGTWEPEYRAWVSMKSRCKYENRDDFKYYGLQGVVVCDEWRADFMAFFAHIGPRPSLTHSVDRINPFGNYEPGNVRWATPVEQANNRRRKHGSAAA